MQVVPSAGLVGLAINLVVHISCSYSFPSPSNERNRVNDMFDRARSGVAVTSELEPSELPDAPVTTPVA